MLDAPPQSSRDSASTDVARPLPAWLVPAIGVCLALLTFGAYLPVWQHDFVSYDDTQYVTENPIVQAGLTIDGIKWAFTTDHAGNWHPLTWLSHMLDVQLFGRGPTGPHAVNLGLHVLNTLFVFLLWRRLTQATWQPAFVAAIFGLHGLHVESVAWVAERKDVLCACFFLLSLWCYAGWARRRMAAADVDGNATGPRPSWSALLFFALALMAKPMAVTLPFVLLLLDYWPLHRFEPASLRQWIQRGLEKAPYFILTIGSCIVTFAVQRRGGAVVEFERFDLAYRLGNALVAYARYLGKSLWPVDLAPFYPHPGVWPTMTIVLAALVFLGLVVVALKGWKRFPWFTVGAFWFLGMLVPTIGFVQVGSQSMADRYMYLPLIGLTVIVAWAASAAAARHRVLRALLPVAAIAILAACGAGTFVQAGYWRDTATLFRHALAVTEGNGVAHDKIGNVLFDRGEIDEALGHFRQAIALQPAYPEFHNNLGNAWWKKGRTEEALAAYRRAIELAPDLAVTHENIGAILVTTGRMAEALPHLQRAVALRPDLVQAQTQLGLVLLDQGRAAEGVAHFERALASNPEYVPARVNLAAAWLRRGRVDDAVAQLQAVLRQEPNDAQAHGELGKALLEQGKGNEAFAELQQAIKLRPNYPEAHYFLGTMLLNSDRLDEAIAHLSAVVELQPESVQARNDLGVALIRRGRAVEATAQFRKAVEVAPELASARNNLGRMLQQEGKWAEAVSHFRAALKAEPENIDTLTNLAWVLATAPDDAVRSGMQAIVLAQRASQQTNHQQPFILRALAAAYAELTRFPEAFGTAERALGIAQQQGDAGLAALIRSDLDTYSNGRPLRDGVPASAAP